MVVLCLVWNWIEVRLEARNRLFARKRGGYLSINIENGVEKRDKERI